MNVLNPSTCLELLTPVYIYCQCLAISSKISVPYIYCTYFKKRSLVFQDSPGFAFFLLLFMCFCKDCFKLIFLTPVSICFQFQHCILGSSNFSFLFFYFQLNLDLKCFIFVLIDKGKYIPALLLLNLFFFFTIRDIDIVFKLQVPQCFRV